MRCTVDHVKVEGFAYDGETIKIDAPMIELVDLLSQHRIVVRNACEGNVLHLDQTHYEARSHRAEVRMYQSNISLAFVQGLLMDSHFFTASKILWSIDFDWVPMGSKKGERRITISFPPQDLPGLVDYIKMKDMLSQIDKGLSAPLETE